MSTIKSSNEHLTLNADGSGKDIKFQSNGSEVASISDGGVVTATSFAGSGAALTGVGVAGISSSADATAITINSSEKVGIGIADAHHMLHIKQNSTANSLGSGVLLQMTNEQGAGNFAALRFTGSNQNGYIGYRDGANDQDRRISMGIGADSEHISFSQAGIKFNGDTAEANGLDDYEEGTWTPTVLGTTSISMRTVYNSHYTKIGNVVTLYTAFALNSSASPATGALRFGGFPFAFKTLGEGSFPIQLYYSYKETPMAFMAPNGYCYYQNTNVGGNNQGGLSEGIFNNVNRNNMGMTFSYLTDA